MADVEVLRRALEAKRLGKVHVLDEVVDIHSCIPSQNVFKRIAQHEIDSRCNESNALHFMQHMVSQGIDLRL